MCETKTVSAPSPKEASTHPMGLLGPLNSARARGSEGAWSGGGGSTWKEIVFHPYKLTSKPEKGKVPQASHPLTHEQLCIEKAASRSDADAQVSKRHPLHWSPAAPPPRNGLLGPRKKEIFSLLGKKNNKSGILLFRYSEKGKSKEIPRNFHFDF